jgi:predicted negative regulator of RcsB-dependent stress response
MLQGDILLSEGKAAESITAYQTAIHQAPTNALRALAMIDLAQAQEQTRKWDDALVSYGNFLKDFSDHFFAPRAYESTGRIQMLQQKWADAQSTFERLVTLYPDSPWAKSAQDYILQIKFQQQKQQTPAKK